MPKTPGFRLGICVFKDDETFLREVARTMECQRACQLRRDAIEYADGAQARARPCA